MWTMDNTNGFTQVELDIINDVREVLLEGFVDQPQSVDDAINNSWVAGISRDDLAHAAKTRLIGKHYGVNPCDHKHYSYSQHGRRCTCNAMMVDPGD